MNDCQFNLIPEKLQRLEKRHKYKENPAHTSLKDKREKRDELKNKKYESQKKKWDQEDVGEGK